MIILIKLEFFHVNTTNLREKAYFKFAGTPSTRAIGGGADLLKIEGVLNVGETLASLASVCQSSRTLASLASVYCLLTTSRECCHGHLDQQKYEYYETDISHHNASRYMAHSLLI